MKHQWTQDNVAFGAPDLIYCKRCNTLLNYSNSFDDCNYQEVNKMDKVYFMHIRNVDRMGNVSNSGGTTVAYRINDGAVEYAQAWCSPTDNYNKAYGRAKATGRLNSNTYRAKFIGSPQAFRNHVYQQTVI